MTPDIPEMQRVANEPVFARNRRIFALAAFLLLLFLTFRDLISIKTGFVLRVPHFLAGIVFILGSLFAVLRLKHKCVMGPFYVLPCVILAASLINGGVASPHFYYLMFIALSMAAFFELCAYYNVSAKSIGAWLGLLTAFHCILSFATFEKTWYGGMQLNSFSDFTVYFAMQLSTIFPFLLLQKKPWVKYGLISLFMLVLALLGSRGAFLALFLAFFLFYFKGSIFRKLLYTGLIVVVVAGFLYVAFPGLFDYYAMKINPFGAKYHGKSDINRWLYLVATVTYLPSAKVFLFGNGVKNNINVIRHFFEEVFLNDIPGFEIHAEATVHNVFLEFYSDMGFISLFILGLVIFRLLYKLYVYRKLAPPWVNLAFMSLLVFVVNYNLEANYVHYHFWFFIAFFHYAVYQTEKLYGKKSK